MIHIPRTAARRGSFEWSKVLHRVSSRAWSGFDFEGRFLRPGASVCEADIFPPDLDHPDFAIILECAGPDRANPDFSSGGRKRLPTLFVLWRYDRHTLTWRELARASSFDAEWTADLGPIAIKALRGSSPPADAAASCDRICGFIESELDHLEGVDLADAVNAVHNRLAARIAATLSAR